MKRFEDLIAGLNRDIEIPEEVDRRFEKTLQELEPKRGKIRFSWGKMAVAAAAVVVLCGMVMVSNPAMASQLPFVGNIFQKVEKDVIYSGNYSKKDTLHVSSDEEA